VKPPFKVPLRPAAPRRASDLSGSSRGSALRCTALNLKAEPIRSDTGSMLFSSHSTPARSGIDLRSVRRALNTPVLAIAQLPVGPASAVIAAHIDSCDGLLRYTLAVRCERSRGVVFFAVREEDLVRSESSLAAEAALSLAEGMGFLFEEDSPPISGEAAASIWEEFVDSADPGAAVAAACPMPLLTKFRRPPSWLAAGSAAIIASEAVTRDVAPGAEAGLALSDTENARQGGR